MRRAFLAVGGLFVLLAAIACGGGDEGLDLSNDPQVFWTQANAAMADLDSYHVAFVFPLGPEEVRWEAEFASPNDYRFLLFSAEGETEEVCESYNPPSGGQGQTCRDVLTNVTSRSVFETIMAGDKAYSRQCEDVGEQCEPWQEGPRPQIPIAGPSPTYLPEWPLVALEMAQPVEVVGGEEIDDVTFIHLHGTVNNLRAILENQRRVLTAAGITSFGEECFEEASLPGAPPGEEICRKLTFEESLERQEPDLSFYDENPATIDIWISPDTFLVRRVALTAQPPPDEPGSGQVPLIVEYTLLNQVEIEAP